MEALEMAVKSLSGFGVCFAHLGRKKNLETTTALAPLQWRRNVRLECLVEEENLSSPLASSVEVKKEGGGEAPMKLNRDSSSLPKPLTAIDLSVSDDGSNVRIAYQGSAGAFSQAAALKAYPQCETVPCDQFEVASKAVELWLVDKAILPIENTLSGSIHQNYDLLRHRLHIVGEVQLAVNYCLMALPGVRKEDLKHILSHPQALVQCEDASSKLGVIRESVDDSAAAAGHIFSKGLRDAGAIASARAAALYGLNVLEEEMQSAEELSKTLKLQLLEGPGVLFKALAVFAFRDINLTKERPMRVVDDSNYGIANLHG